MGLILFSDVLFRKSRKAVGVAHSVEHIQLALPTTVLMLTVTCGEIVGLSGSSWSPVLLCVYYQQAVIAGRRAKETMFFSKPASSSARRVSSGTIRHDDKVFRIGRDHHHRQYVEARIKRPFCLEECKSRMPWVYRLAFRWCALAVYLRWHTIAGEPTLGVQY